MHFNSPPPQGIWVETYLEANGPSALSVLFRHTEPSHAWLPPRGLCPAGEHWCVPDLSQPPEQLSRGEEGPKKTI